MLTYTDELVNFIRALDCLELCVGGAHQASGLDGLTPEELEHEDPGGWRRWLAANLENLGENLPNLRKMASSMIENESPFSFDVNATGDALPPECIRSQLQPCIDECLVADNSEPPHVIVNLPVELKKKAANSRVIIFDGEAFIIPEDIHDSVVEVWFRRMFIGPVVNEVYRMYLVKRDYGWQAYGCER